MNILAIGAHPDDIELGCAGTLLKYSAARHQVSLLILSDGRQAGNPKIRKKEQQQAAKLLSVKEIFWGDFKDTHFIVEGKMIQLIENTINKVKPDEIYVNYVEDTHQDHRALAQSVMAASRYHPRVLFYEDYTSINFIPDIYVDIKDVLAQKIKIIECHHSQSSKLHPSGCNMIENVTAVARFRGFQAKVQYAEGFKSLRYLKKMDCNVSCLY